MNHVRIKSVVRNVIEKSDGAASPFLGLEDIESGTGRLLVKELPLKAAEDSICHQSGDVLFSKLRPYLTKSYLSQEIGTGTGELLVLRPRAEMDANFLLYVTLSNPWIEWANTTAYGTKMPRTSWDLVGSYQTWLPLLEEQRRIADFLDVETARIDSLARLGKRQINLLRERSEAMVAQFFGPGDGRREYRFRNLMESNPCYGVLVPKFTDVGVPLIRVSDLGKLGHDLERLPRIEEKQAQEYKRTRISPGDLLITVVGATIGRCDVAPPETTGFNVSRALARVQMTEDISPQMIASWVRGRDFRIQAEIATSGAAAQPALNMSDITHFTIWLPETRAGRQGLAHRVSTHDDETRRLLSAMERKQALIAERRRALITAAVTGQFDVSTASGRNVTDGVTA